MATIVGTTFSTYTGIAAPAVSPAGKGRFYFDSTSNTFKFSSNAGPYVDMGDVVGPSAATNFGLARFDATTGKLIKNTSGWTIDDSNLLNAVFNTAGYGMTIQNTAVSGELLQFINSFGNPSHQFNKDGGGNGITRVKTNAGVNTFEWFGSGFGSMGPANSASAAWPLTIQGAVVGNGQRIRAGNALGNIAFRVSNQSDTFGDPGGAIIEVEANQGFITLSKSYVQTLIDQGIVYGVDNQNPGNAKDFNTQFGVYRIAGNSALAGEFSSTDPPAPAAGASIFSRLRAGRRMAAQIGPSAEPYIFQPALFQSKIGWWTAAGNVTTVAVSAMGNTITGTATARVVSTASLAASIRQVAYVSAATAGASCGTRNAAIQFYRNAGFFYVARFVIDTVLANMRWFVGFTGAAAVIGNVDPSTLTNILGFAIDSGQTTVRFMNNDAAGAATATDLGASFPAATAGVVYEARIFSTPGGASVSYSLERLDSAALVEGSVNSDLPGSTQLLSTQIWMNNGAAGNAAVAVGVSNQYIETDN